MKHRPSPPYQLSFASARFAQKTRVTRHEKLLAEMGQKMVRWTRLQALIELEYPTAGRVGRCFITGGSPGSGLDHTTVATESNVAHSHEVLHRQESQVFQSAGYTSVAQREEILRPQAESRIRSDLEWNVVARRSTITKMAEGTIGRLINFK